MRVLPLLLGLFLAVGLASPAAAQNPALPGFSEVEKRLIRTFFAAPAAAIPESGDAQGNGDAGASKRGKNKAKTKGKSKQMPPGLAKKEELPKGLAQHLERHGTLPPGLAKRNLPGDLDARLPPTGPGQERVIVDNDVVLVQRTTGRILDIIRDVVRPR